MFQDIGEVPEAMFQPLRAASEKWLRPALASGGYIGWLASAATAPETIVAGAGVQLRSVAPHLHTNAEGKTTLARGRHAIVLNVFTEPKWRQQGIGTLLMREIIRWAGMEKLDRLVLHASAQGRQLYERLGFISTNEMRYARDLLPPNQAAVRKVCPA